MDRRRKTPSLMTRSGEARPSSIVRPARNMRARHLCAALAPRRLRPIPDQSPSSERKRRSPYHRPPAVEEMASPGRVAERRTRPAPTETFLRGQRAITLPVCRPGVVAVPERPAGRVRALESGRHVPLRALVLPTGRTWPRRAHVPGANTAPPCTKPCERPERCPGPCGGGTGRRDRAWSSSGAATSA